MNQRGRAPGLRSALDRLADVIAWARDRNVGLGPEHDWSSHAADAFGYLAISYEEPPQVNK